MSKHLTGRQQPSIITGTRPLRTYGHYKRGRLIGMDLVEVTPHFDVNGIISRTALRLVIDFLTVVFEEKHWRR